MKNNSVSAMFKAVPAWVKLLIYAVLAFFAWLAFGRPIKRWFAKLNMQADTKDYESSGNNVVVPNNQIPNNEGNQSGQTEINFIQKAQQIYDAFYNNDWFGFTEDEQTAIDTILSVPKPYVPSVALAYSQISSKGYTMYADFQRLLTSSQYAQVSSHLS